jgi:hypothetical protein
VYHFGYTLYSKFGYSQNAKTNRHADPRMDKGRGAIRGRADGNGLYLRYREADKTPTWRFRYKLAGKSRAMLIGSYAELSLAKARETAKELSAAYRWVMTLPGRTGTESQSTGEN